MTDRHEHEPSAAPDGTYAGAGSKSRSSSRERERARRGSKRDTDRIQRRLRGRAAGFVALMLAGVLVAGAVVRPSLPLTAGSRPSGQLPSVTLTSHSSVEWDCPGPLPAGASTERSAVVVAHPGNGTALVVVDAVAVRATGKALGAALPGWTTRLRLGPFSERIVALARSGPAQDDAVSVLSTAGAVAVFESVSPAGTRAVRPHAQSAPSAPEQSPCSPGAATRSYLASGSTEGESDVLVSLFDPTATQAVAGIRVSTGSGSVTPPALQGLIVRPYSLQVFDLARSVVQQPAVAISVTTTAGSLAVGASETVASDATAATSASGRALVIGIGRPQDRWVLTPGLGSTQRNIGVRVYDPGSRAATVTISSPVGGTAPIEITEAVPAGQVRTIQLPMQAAPVGKTPKAPGNERRASPTVEGPIVVQAAEGVGVVVSRIAVLTVRAHEETVAFAAVTSAPANDWIVPATASGVDVGGGIVISNSGLEPAEVTVVGLTTHGGAASTSHLTTLTVAPRTSTTALLSLPTSGGTFCGVLVTASARVVVEQDFFALATPHRSPAAHEFVPVAPVPVEGIPVIG